MSTPSAPEPDRRPTPPPTPPALHVEGTVGGDVVAGDLHREQNAGRDIVGRDVVTNTTSSTTNVGFSAAMVQRLLITVGALVAATAACFFILGGVTVAGFVAALHGPPNNNNPAAAAAFQLQLSKLADPTQGPVYNLQFTEEELSSYFHLLAEPPAISNGQVRLLNSEQVLIAGNANPLGGREFAAVFNWQTDKPGAPLRLTGLWINAVPLGRLPLGWVQLPAGSFGWLADAVNQLFQGAALQDIHPQPNGPGWDVSVARPQP